MNIKKKRTYPMSIYAIIIILVIIAVIFFFSDSQERHSKYANRRIHAFYYTHWGTPKVNNDWYGWNAQNLAPTVPDYILNRFKPDPPLQMSTSYYPKLGPYSSNDPDVVENHMKQIVQSHIGVLVLGWMRPIKSQDAFLKAGYENQTISLVMDIAHKYNVKICFHLLHYSDQTEEEMLEDIKTIFDTYSDHPAFYRAEDFEYPKGVNGKPIFYIEGVQYKPPSFWKSLFGKDGEKKGKVRKEYDAIYIAKLIAEQQLNIILKSGFDGIYTWHGSHISSPVANPLKWRDLAFWAETNGLIFAPTVSPGYNSFKYNLGYTLHVTERKKGETYEESWKSAIESSAPIVSVNSFNQWHLGSQIEAAVPKKIKEGERDYLDYEDGSPNMYLDLTRKWASKYSFFLSTNKNRDFFFAEKKPADSDLRTS